MKRHFTFVVTLAFLILGASGANVALTTSVGTPITAGASGGDILISVVSDDAAPPAVENLTGWQLSLKIVPDGGSTGNVSFATVFAPVPTYILAGINNGVSATKSTLTTTDDSLFAFDFNDPFTGGAQVPIATGQGLLQLTFTASGGALGTFGLFATPGVGFSEWSDNAGGGPAVRAYANLPGATDIQIGQITVIPEPASGMLALFGLASLVLVRRRSKS